MTPRDETSPIESLPPIERAQHNRIERLPETISDSSGGIGQPFRAIDVLEQMFRSRKIDLDQYQAGIEFRDDFRSAQHDNLRAADAGRITGGGMAPEFGVGAIDARDRVWQALLALGGHASPAGSMAWFVLGCEWSVLRWLEGHSFVRRSTAYRMVPRVLDMLASHYEKLRDDPRAAPRKQRRRV